MSAYLFRGIAADRFTDVAAALQPKVVGPFVAPLVWDQFNWDDAEWGDTERNAVVRHQWEQLGLSTSGLSTTPLFERAGFYAQSGNLTGQGFILVIDRARLGLLGVQQFVVNEIVQSPAVPEDEEVILRAANGHAIPESLVVDVRPWP